ncbi:AraC family transcriptional regulator [Paenibacillus elgii]|uniref:AraC family transcriptional regulator n=1 Tax=Paenibacillus elgii TaxID=189691 RepID=A0A2T6FTH9_9BACL|nr:AraC family transcriptional regulator [Paenibacillus elgii]PUA35211.1 AraC family transcriptional regulator [Paenibacillus elgii]
MIVLWDVDHEKGSGTIVGHEIEEMQEYVPIRCATHWEEVNACVQEGCGALFTMTSRTEPPPEGDGGALPSGVPQYLITHVDKQAKLLIRFFLFYLASLSLDSNRPLQPSSAGTHEIDWNKSIQYIQDNLDNSELSLEEVAKQNYVCKWHFSKMFKKQFGITFREFLIQERIDLAKRMLLTDESVTNVCYAVGYGDLTHFGRMFQKKVGMPPSRFKSMHWKKTGSKEGSLG